MSTNSPNTQPHDAVTSLEAHVVEHERKVLRIVETLLATPEQMRATDLAVHCGNDIYLLRRVERLLAHVNNDNDNALWSDLVDALSGKSQDSAVPPPSQHPDSWWFRTSNFVLRRWRGLNWP